ncbi:cytochrome P450 [Tengunoibacter tsumagoiensis]|uniref:Putative cytochrome P450 YjiB n=1 Tax=Tengunoibacter tsumagoiensis TaxID=2014871 RepID=A0A402AA03_9CHLR|nr:cytochrome P450 [Tengunoibacter tsumagoiensis]GCE15785.1 putative cytochrome P450 YjiB [Tengunoibacter tsumagoiensis]
MATRQTPLMDPAYFEQLFSPYPGFSPTAIRPAYFDTTMNVWNVFRYKDVQRIFSDYKTFSTAREIAFPPVDGMPDPVNVSMGNQNPPNHTRLRKLSFPSFTARTTGLEPTIAATVESLILKVKDQGRMDLIADFSNPWPAIIVAKILGVPEQDYRQFMTLSFEYMNFMTPESARATVTLIKYFEALVEERQRRPQEDMISDLLHDTSKEDRLSIQELIGTCMFMIVAGQAPGPLLINTILACEVFPDLQPTLRAHPELIQGAFDEVMRFFSPVVSSIPRVTLQETQFDGQVVPKGSLVIPWISAANRDPEQFEQPDVFDIRRSPNRHLTFGFGIHFCIGAPLARLEGEIALNLLFQHLKNIEIDYSEPLVRLDSPLLFSVKQAPIKFTV